jgi:hypothetical protein
MVIWNRTIHKKILYRSFNGFFRTSVESAVSWGNVHPDNPNKPELLRVPPGVGSVCFDDLLG